MNTDIEKRIINSENFNFNDIILHNKTISNDEYILMELSHNNMNSILVNIESLYIYKYLENTNEIILDITKHKKLKKFFESFDKKILNLFKSKKIFKKLASNGITYKTLVCDLTQNNYNVLKLKLSFNDDYKSTIYDCNQTLLDKNNLSLFINNNSKSKMILEFIALIVDKKNNTLYVDTIIRQIQIKKIHKIQREKNITFSFIDSDNEKINNNSSENNSSENNSLENNSSENNSLENNSLENNSSENNSLENNSLENNSLENNSSENNFFR